MNLLFVGLLGGGAAVCFALYGWQRRRRRVQCKEPRIAAYIPVGADVFCGLNGEQGGYMRTAVVSSDTPENSDPAPVPGNSLDIATASEPPDEVFSVRFYERCLAYHSFRRAYANFFGHEVEDSPYRTDEVSELFEAYYYWRYRLVLGLVK